MPEQTTQQSMGMLKETDYSSVLKVRLDTAPILEKIEIYLTGKVQTIAYDKNNKPIVVEKTLSDPKANDQGIHWLLNFVSNIINPSTVQGNFLKEEMFYHYLFEIRSSLIYNLMKNMYIWGIKDYDYEPIIDNIMIIVIPFMTRPLGNKERESYGGMKVVESSTVEQKNRGFSLNPFGKGG